MSGDDIFMTLRHLQIFLCVCDEESMTAAAQKLRVAQPSISQAIAELERYYDVKLFERLGRRLFITAAGQKLLNYARHIIHLNKEAEEAMREISGCGTIRIGASVTVGTYVLSNMLLEFTKKNPKVKINSYVNNTKVIEDMLLLDQIDIGLVEGQIHSQSLLSQPFMADELVLVCASSHPFASKSQISPEELNDMEFLVREEGSGTRELFESVMAACGVTWRVAGVYNNAETIKNAVAAGLAVAVMSRMSVQKEVAKNELAISEIEGMNFRRQFIMVYHKNKYISPVLKSFIRLCATASGYPFS